VWFWVTDEEPGIPPQHVPHVFERFDRVDPSRGRAGGGIVLDPSICKTIVEAHGGRSRLRAHPTAARR